MAITEYMLELGIDELALKNEINEIFAPKEGEFIIDSLDRAEYVAGRVDICHKHIQEAQEVANKKLKKLDEVLGRERMNILHEMEAHQAPWKNQAKELWFRFGTQMQRFVEERLKAGKSKRRSEHIGPFIIGFKKQPEQIKVTDQDATMTWARENLPEAIKTDERLMLTSVKDYVKELEKTAAEALAEGSLTEAEVAEVTTLPPGVVKQAASDKFYVTAGKAELNLILGINTAIENEENDHGGE